MIETEYFTTKDVSEKTNKSPYAILKYARTKTTIKTEGEGNQKRYYWRGWCASYVGDDDGDAQKTQSRR